jgi:hypothetical protein
LLWAEVVLSQLPKKRDGLVIRNKYLRSKSKPNQTKHMKQLLMMLLALSLFAACKNDTKQKDKSSNRPEKDDYRSGEKETEKETENTNKTDYSSNNSDWSATDVSRFNNDCRVEMAKSNPEFADKFCPCLLDKMQAKFSSYSDMEAKGNEAEARIMGEDCAALLKRGNAGDNTNSGMTTGSGWPQVERRAFITSCEKKAIAGGRDKYTAQSYCACMLEKMEGDYPDINDASRLTERQVEAIVNKYKDGCLEEH